VREMLSSHVCRGLEPQAQHSKALPLYSSLCFICVKVQQQ